MQLAYKNTDSKKLLNCSKKLLNCPIIPRLSLCHTYHSQSANCQVQRKFQNGVRITLFLDLPLMIHSRLALMPPKIKTEIELKTLLSFGLDGPENSSWILPSLSPYRDMSLASYSFYFISSTFKDKFVEFLHLLILVFAGASLARNSCCF